MRERRCVSQIKEKYEPENRSVTKLTSNLSTSAKKDSKKFNIFNFSTSKGRDSLRREGINTSMERKSSKSYKFSAEIDENGQHNINRLVK